MEEKLKIVIRARKTGHFYKTVNDAGVANVLISLIATVYNAGENVYDFLKRLQRYQQDLKSNPVAWLPSNYKKTIEAIELAEKNSKQDRRKFSDAVLA
jgi:transposase